MSEYGHQQAVNCDEVEALLPAYSLGALDDAEVAVVERGLVDCPDLNSELRQYTAMTQNLMFTLDPVKPDASLKQSILAAAREETRTPAKTIPFEQPAPPRGRSWQGWLTAAAMFAVLVGSNLVWLQRYDALQRQTPVVGTTTDLSSLVATGPVTRVDLATNVADTDPTGALAWTPIEPDVSWVSWFVANNLQPSPDGTVYQLWLMREGEPPVRVGQFQVNESGNAAFVFEIYEPIGSFDTVQVTLEADETVTVPTGETVLVSEIDV